jgi:hypothetical protein
MDEPTRIDHRDEREARQLWSEAVWGLGMIAAVAAP